MRADPPLESPAPSIEGDLLHSHTDYNHNDGDDDNGDEEKT